MKFWRCQRNEATSAYEFNSMDGAVGMGIYAMLEGDKKLQKYYSQMGEDTYEFEIDDKYVTHVKGVGLGTYWSIRERIYELKERGYKAFIVKHHGINIPTSKQVLIVDSSVITNFRKL